MLRCVAAVGVGVDGGGGVGSGAAGVDDVDDVVDIDGIAVACDGDVDVAVVVTGVVDCVGSVDVVGGVCW